MVFIIMSGCEMDVNEANEIKEIKENTMVFMKGMIDESFYRTYLLQHAFLPIQQDMNAEMEYGGRWMFTCLCTIVGNDIVWIIYHHEDKYLAIETPNTHKIVAAFMEFNEFEVSETNISLAELSGMIYSAYHHFVPCIELIAVNDSVYSGGNYQNCYGDSGGGEDDDEGDGGYNEDECWWV